MAALSSVLVTTNKNKCRITRSEVFLSNGWKVTNTIRPSIFVFPSAELAWITSLCKISVHFWTGTAWRKDGVRVEGVLWVNLAPILLVVIGKSVHRPEGRVVLGGGFCSRVDEFSFCRRGHKCTEETLVALKENQINNLGSNDSQVWSCRDRHLYYGPAVGPLPSHWWHGPQWEHNYVISSAVGQSQPQENDECCCSEFIILKDSLQKLRVGTYVTFLGCLQCSLTPLDYMLSSTTGCWLIYISSLCKAADKPNWFTCKNAHPELFWHSNLLQVLEKKG